ncbi:MAG: hypothetical protein J7518_21000 [Nocardioidaceae bacterium]|nr:hypothetical protein [Nocardioidaceae bacterium]
MQRIYRARKRLLGLLALVVASVLVAPPVMAATWYSASSPLKVYDNQVAQGYAYGDFKNNSDVSARSYSWQKDPRPGGSGIYVETSFYFYEPCGTGAGTEWCYSAKKSTENTTSGSWIADYTARYLSSAGSQARGTMKVCENHSWASDPCSAKVTKSFSY